ncbi:MAG: hypothetical protein AB8B87_11395 [Granulosicoccus sp.]
MIWICTIFLLIVAAWLFFNALNERRWVQAHSQDETVAADKGLFPAFSTRTGTGSLPADGKLSINQESSIFARTVSRIQNSTSGLGEKYFDAKAAAARIDDPTQRPRSAREENTLFGRAVARIGAKAESIDQKLDVKMKQASSFITRSANNEDPFARASRQVAATSVDMVDKMKKGAMNIHRPKADDRTLFGKVLGKVSGGMEKFEAQVKTRASTTRSPEAKPDEDLVSRVTSKIGSTIKKLDKKE